MLFGYGLEECSDGCARTPALSQLPPDQFECYRRFLRPAFGNSGLRYPHPIRSSFEKGIDGFPTGKLAHLRLRSRRFGPVMDDRLAHRHALPVGPINFLPAPLCFRSAGHVLRRLRDDFLRKIHHALVVGISLIELEHRELRIPAPSEALVAEVAVDLVFSK